MKTNISRVIRIRLKDTLNQGPGDLEAGEPKTIYLEKDPPKGGTGGAGTGGTGTGGGAGDGGGQDDSIPDPSNAYSKDKAEFDRQYEEDFDYKEDKTKVTWGEILPGGALTSKEDSDVSKASISSKWDEMVRSAMAQNLDDPLSKRLTKKLQGLKSPVVDWKAELARFIEKVITKVTYKLPSRRFSAQKTAQYGYKRTREEVECIVVAIDTSGSISDKMVHRFLSETQSIVASFDPRDLYVIFCHTDIYRVDHYLPGEKISDGQLKSGGTEFWPPFAWVQNNLINEGITPAIFIYFTDGYAKFPSPNDYEIGEYAGKVIWAVLSFDGSPSPVEIPWGNRMDIILPNKTSNL